MPASTLNCPACGAAVSGDSTQCEYCGSRLQTVACPSCFGLMFAGSQFCPHCGTAAQAAKPSSPTSHKCPRCQTALQALTIGQSPLEECPHCGGLWVQPHAFDRICADRESQTAAIGITLPPPLPPEIHVHYLKCPQCSNLMGRMNYAHRSGVIIDICPPHGIWFDRDGLRHIVEFIRAGGLDRQRELEKQQLDEERRHLDSQQSAGFHSDTASLIGPATSSYLADDLLFGVSSILKWFTR